MKRIIVKKDTNYTTINNEFVFNKNMSLQAKGLLCHLLAVPADWKLYIEELTNWHTNGKRSVYTCINELIKLGYLERKQIREAGKIKGNEYIVYEKPQSGFVDTENVKTQNVETQNEPLLNKDLTNNLIKLNTKEGHLEFLNSVEGLNVEAWLTWCQYRMEQHRTKYKPMSEKAAIKKLLKLSNGVFEVQEKIIIQSIENSWRGLFELKNKQGKIEQTLNAWQKARNIINNG